MHATDTLKYDSAEVEREKEQFDEDKSNFPGYSFLNFDDEDGANIIPHQALHELAQSSLLDSISIKQANGNQREASLFRFEELAPCVAGCEKKFSAARNTSNAVRFSTDSNCLATQRAVPLVELSSPNAHGVSLEFPNEDRIAVAASRNSINLDSLPDKDRMSEKKYHCSIGSLPCGNEGNVSFNDKRGIQNNLFQPSWQFPAVSPSQDHTKFGGSYSCLQKLTCHKHARRDQISMEHSSLSNSMFEALNVTPNDCTSVTEETRLDPRAENSPALDVDHASYFPYFKKMYFSRKETFRRESMADRSSNEQKKSVDEATHSSAFDRSPMRREISDNMEIRSCSGIENSSIQQSKVGCTAFPSSAYTPRHPTLIDRERRRAAKCAPLPHCIVDISSIDASQALHLIGQNKISMLESGNANFLPSAKEGSVSVVSGSNGLNFTNTARDNKNEISRPMCESHSFFPDDGEGFTVPSNLFKSKPKYKFRSHRDNQYSAGPLKSRPRFSKPRARKTRSQLYPCMFEECKSVLRSNFALRIVSWWQFSNLQDKNSLIQADIWQSVLVIKWKTSSTIMNDQSTFKLFTWSSNLTSAASATSYLDSVNISRAIFVSSMRLWIDTGILGAALLLLVTCIVWYAISLIVINVSVRL